MASISYSLLLLLVDRLLPWGTTSPSCPGAPRPSRQLVRVGSQRSSTSTRPPPPPLYTLLISALGRRQTPQLMPPPHESRLLQQGGESRSAHPDSRQVNARPSSSPNSPKPPPRIDDGRGVGLPHRLRHHAPPLHYATPLAHFEEGCPD